MNDRSSGGRRFSPSVAYMDGPLVGEKSIQAGVIARARARECSLIVFAGGMLECPREYEAQRSVIFDLYNPDLVDGIIISSDYLGHNVGSEKMKSFCQKFLPVPVVTNELPMEAIPTLETPFYQGMYDLISHLIEAHQYTRVAFIRGLEQSKTGNDRFQAYRDALKDHSISYDKRLVAPGHFYSPSGQEAVSLFFDQLSLRPGIDIQAIAAVTDFIAFDTILALKERGIRVPDDIAVVGFDDDEDAYSADPPLTTVHLPFHEMGEWAVDAILALIHKDSVPDITPIPVSLVIRQSCGCVNPAIREAFVRDSRVLEQPGQEQIDSADKREQFLFEIGEGLGIQNKLEIKQSLEEFYDLFMNELFQAHTSSSSLSFIKGVQKIVKKTGVFHRNINIWTEILSALRQEWLPCLADHDILARFENLCHLLRVLIEDQAQQTLSQEKHWGKQMDRLLDPIYQEMTTAVSVIDLMDVLARSLPYVRIPSCFLSLYEVPDQPGQRSRLVFAYDERGRMDLGPTGVSFPSNDLVPDRTMDFGKPHILIIEPLFFRKERFGFVLFEVGSTYFGTLYEALAEQTSTALKRIFLHQEAEKALRQAEEADRLKSRFLSMVSHELRTPLSMIVSLSDLLLHEGQAWPKGAALPYRHELEVIHATGQHLDRLLRDVLDLGRSQLGQLKLEWEAVDILDVAGEAAVVGRELAREKGLNWRLALPASLPRVWADRTRLRQILLNLISNACKFTTRGEVALEAHSGLGEVVVSILDTGLGIPPAEQGTIFDEFHQSERTAARGYGGMGLGLAITRRLVEMHGGKISVISSGQEGAGAAFTLRLPVIPPEREVLPAAAGWEQAVLLLTERDVLNHFLRQHLEACGFQVIVWNPGEEPHWLEQVTAALPGAIILDCEPSSAWGARLLNAIKENPVTCHLPVLFTCLAPDASCGSVLELQTLAKPLGANELASVLERLGLQVKAAPEKPLSAMAPPDGIKTFTILVVDDEPAVLELHARRVREQLPGSEVLEARNGLQALEVMQQVRPDLVILDLMMPELDGFGVLERMRALESTRTIPVIILTAQNLTDEVMQRLNRGVAAVLGKGVFDRQEFLAQVETALARSKRLGSEGQRIARRAMAYLHEHYTEPVSRQAIARAVGVDERYMTRCFHAETGITPIDYLNRYRVKQARLLLDEGSQSITEIALETGFSSSAYFSRVFRKETGQSPHEYRRGGHPNQAGRPEM